MHILLLASLHGPALAWNVKTNSSGAELHWVDRDVEFSLNTDGAHELSPEAVEDMVAASAQQWNMVDGSHMSLLYQGDSARHGDSETDATNVIFFEDDWPLAEELLAVTYVWSMSDGEITAFDMAVNTRDHEWATSGDVERHDLMNTITHEFGHAVGVDHSEDAYASMFATSETGEVVKRDVSPDDMEAVRHLYSVMPEDGPLPVWGCMALPASPGGLVVVLGGLLGWSRRRRRDC